MTAIQTDETMRAELRRAVALARAGDAAAARAIAERLLAQGGEAVPLHAFLGMLACQNGDLQRGAEHLGIAHAANPDDLTITLNLANALMDGGRTTEALAICSAAAADRDPSRRLWRMRAYLSQLAGDFSAAGNAYEKVVAHAPQDFESWNNLGNARAAAGDGEGSLIALQRAVSLRSDIAPLRLNLATTLSDMGRLDEAATVLEACARDFSGDAKPLSELAGLRKRQRRDEAALDALTEAARREPADLDLQIRLGTELATAWRMDEAERIFVETLAIDPLHREAHTRLALIYEHTNRAASLDDHADAAEAKGVDPGAVQFTRALALRHQRRFAEGLGALAATASDVEPVRQAQMLGQFHDGLGNAPEAFEAFREMNRLLVADRPELPALAEGYRDQVARERAAVTGDWFAGWRQVPGDMPRTPVFLVGFPRSGTTLLDTLLMGHPDVQVLEERPPLAMAESAIGGFEGIGAAGAAEIATARAAYFEEAAKWIDLRPDSLLVDKFPLHMNKVPLIHRLFPGARFILALRHPMDVVLSCFITNFRPNQAMSNFTDLRTTADLYDLSFGNWEQARDILPISAQALRYEQMIADPAGTLKPLFAYLGLDWRDTVLDHRETAVGRGVITTASYAQVTEPIYDRAKGRWRRYADALRPVRPILDPWIARYGYEAG